MTNWFDHRKTNAGLANEREYKRLLEGKYRPNTKMEYTPDEYYELIRFYEESESENIKRRMDRRQKRLQQIKELQKNESEAT